MNRSSEEIEREVEATRGDLDRTVEALKDKMSPGQLIDELASAFKGSGSSDIVSNLGSQVRDNPLAVAMIGAGFAWLMMGDKAKPSTSDWSAMQGDMTGRSPSSETGAGSAASKLGDGASAIGDKAGEALHQLKDKAADAAGGVKHAAQSAGSTVGQVGGRLSSSLTGLLEREPLVVAGLGLAVGAALGAALPATALEDRTFGEARDRLMKEGRSFAKDGVEKAKHVAGVVYDEVKDEADKQGLTGSGEGDSLVDKAESLVRRGVEAARTDIQSQTN